MYSHFKAYNNDLPVTKRNCDLPAEKDYKWKLLCRRPEHLRTNMPFYCKMRRFCCITKIANSNSKQSLNPKFNLFMHKREALILPLLLLQIKTWETNNFLQIFASEFIWRKTVIIRNSGLRNHEGHSIAITIYREIFHWISSEITKNI